MITVELPQNIERQLSATWPDLPRVALESLALEGYRREVLSRRQVGEALGLDRWQVENFLKEHGVTRHYDLDDLNQDLAVNRTLLGDAP